MAKHMSAEYHSVDSFALYHGKAEKKKFRFKKSELVTRGVHPEMQQSGIRNASLSVITPIGSFSPTCPCLKQCLLPFLLGHM